MMPWTSSVHYQRRVGYVMYQQGWYRERQPLVPYREEAFFIDGKCVELTFHHV